jgi:hypothetical protein
MANPALSSVGLVFDIAGVILLFWYAPPQPDLEEGVGIGLASQTPLADGRTVAEHNVDVRRVRQKHQRLSKLALGLIIAGFVVQLIAVWLP